MPYVILCEEPDIDPYVLADAGATLADAQVLMAHRAEEFVDEQATIDAENETEVGELVIELDENQTITRVRPIVDGVMRAPSLTMTLAAVTING